MEDAPGSSASQACTASVYAMAPNKKVKHRPEEEAEEALNPGGQRGV